MIYLDSCILIYLVEESGELTARARSLFASAHDDFVISPLVIHECLVVPLRRDDQGLIEEYGTVFESLLMVDLDLAAFVRAAELRAANAGLRTADALHLSAAQLAGCTALWTNDRRLAAASAGLAVDVIDG